MWRESDRKQENKLMRENCNRDEDDSGNIIQEYMAA